MRATLYALAPVVALGLSMTASPLVLTASPSTVTISWEGVSNPQSNDWVAQYCSDASGPDNFGSWAYVSTCSSGDYTKGSCTIFTLSVTQDSLPCSTIKFSYFRDPSPYTFVASSNTVAWNSSNPTGDTPRHVHLAYGIEPRTSLTLSYTTDDGTTPGIVQVGTAPGVYDIGNFTAAPAVSYAADDCCGASSAWSFPGYFHHTFISGLKEDTRYYALPTQGSVKGTETTFRTAPPLGTATTVKAIIMADMSESGGSGAVTTASRMAAWAEEVSFVAHIGDLSYGEGNVNTWNIWMDLIEPIASKVQYHVSIGNHEYDYEGTSLNDPSGVTKTWHPSFSNAGGDSGGECGVPTSRRFRMPSNGNGVFWYSFSSGPVHVIMVSSEHDPSPGSPMGNFLAQDLAAVDRSVTPWVVVGIHRPLVETENYPGDYDMAAGLRNILEPLFLQTGVDAVLAGHYHSFQRSCRMANLKCVTDPTLPAMIHYTTGAAGAGLDSVSLIPSDYIEKTIEGKWGYSIMTANATHLTLDFHGNIDDSILDTVTLSKE